MRNKLSAIALLTMMLLSLTYAQEQSPARPNKGTRRSEANGSRGVSSAGGADSGKGIVTPTAAGTNQQVLGNGTIGRLPKWTGFTSSNSIIGDSTIFEDKNGFIGIGTAPTDSKLTVNGTIQSLSGGFKFPDGTIQTTAGIAPSQVVRSLNGLMGDLSLVPGANITITAGANTLTIGATGLLSTVNHDATLTGNGTSASPLGVAVPLNLSGSVSGGFQNEDAAILRVTNTAFDGNGVRGVSNGFGAGVQGISSDGFGVVGTTNGTSPNAAGVIGNSSGDPTGSIAGKFVGKVSIVAGQSQPGDLSVEGMLSKGGGSFKIDHPLDPENKYLYHSFVESPDMKNIYDGNVVTDENGEATIELPAYFEALNRDFRYQLTVLGTFAQAIVGDEIKANRFVIRTSMPNVKVSWQVTGIRRDAWANKNRIKVEEEKSERERGHYLHPDAFDQPQEKSIQWARDPEGMKQLKQRRAEAEQTRKQQKQLDH